MEKEQNCWKNCIKEFIVAYGKPYMPVSYDTIANIQMDRGTTSLGDLGLPPLITLHKK